MGMLDGKRFIIFGVASKRSIAWGIADAMHREGARLWRSRIKTTDLKTV